MYRISAEECECKSMRLAAVNHFVLRKGHESCLIIDLGRGTPSPVFHFPSVVVVSGESSSVASPPSLFLSQLAL